ncbi:MAG TPA: flagellar export protein FliJ [Bacillota bacterium]
MKKFKFKLETVLKVKIRVEEERLHQLQQAELKRDEARARLVSCQAELGRVQTDYRQSLQHGFDRYLANDYHQYLLWLEQQRQKAFRHLQECQREAVRARQALLVAVKERKILDKLKEHAYETYQAAVLKAEINFLDELGTGRFIRQKQAQGGN